jgi:hypothetical protein
MARDRKTLALVTAEPNEGTPEASQDAPLETTPKGPLAREGKRKNLTLRITPDLDFRLMSIAIKEGMSKRELAHRFVEQGAAKHGVDKELKAVFTRLIESRPAV